MTACYFSTLRYISGLYTSSFIGFQSGALLLYCLLDVMVINSGPMRFIGDVKMVSLLDEIEDNDNWLHFSTRFVLLTHLTSHQMNPQILLRIKKLGEGPKCTENMFRATLIVVLNCVSGGIHARVSSYRHLL